MNIEQNAFLRSKTTLITGGMGEGQGRIHLKHLSKKLNDTS